MNYSSDSMISRAIPKHGGIMRLRMDHIILSLWLIVFFDKLVRCIRRCAFQTLGVVRHRRTVRSSDFFQKRT